MAVNSSGVVHGLGATPPQSCCCDEDVDFNYRSTGSTEEEEEEESEEKARTLTQILQQHGVVLVA